MSAERSRARILPVSIVTALAIGVAPFLSVAPATAAEPPTAAPLVITEIQGDNVGYDHFEYVEVHNTSGAALDLAAAGISFAYTFADSADRTGDKALVAEPLVLGPDETALLWVSYTAANVDSFSRTADDFRAFHGVDADTQVVRLTGQAGIANGGARGVRVLQGGETVSWSFAPTGGFSAGSSVHFRLPEDAAALGLDVFGLQAEPSPGTVLAEALQRPGAQPEPQPDPVPAASWPLIVTEIAPDNVGDDHFEFFEVHNPTASDIDLAAGGFSFAYIYVDGADRARDVPLAIAEPTVIPAGGTVVFWLSYATGAVDSFAHSEADFRAHWGAADDTAVVRVTGQSGMANGAPRGIRVLRAGEIVSWSTYGRTATAPGQSAHFRIPADPAQLGMPVLAEPAAASPGVVVPEALTPLPGEPTPAPTATPSATPTTTPTAAPSPQPGLDPQPDPDVVTAPLQITELLPDSANVNGADGYEFIEVYNATSSPIDFSDYVIDYLYPDTNSSAVWPAVPADVVIPGGGTLVFWIKNGANDALTATEFNRHFGTDLVLGEDLVEISSAGMANGSARGIAIETNTGRHVSSAFYNLNGARDTAADRGIRYTATDDLTTQRILDVAAATPGRVQADQVPAGLMIVPADTSAPVIEDRTAGAIEPGQNFAVTAAVTDDVQVRTVTLAISNDVDREPVRWNLVDDGTGVLSHVLQAADLTGKSWYEYTITASDGTNVAETEVRRVPVSGATTDPVRLNLTDGQFVTGTTPVVAAGDDYPSPIELSIDGEAVPTEPALEGQPLFVFETTNINYYFKNGVRIGDDVLTIFDKGTTGWETVVTPVPLTYVQQGEDLVVSVWSGTKKAPEIDLAENNDDFEIRALRLVLPDGRTLTPAGYTDPATVLRMGDSTNETPGASFGNPTGKLDFYDARFAIADDAFSAVRADWNTSERADGSATVAAAAGETSVSRMVQVDNTAPSVTSQIVDGSAYQGPITIDAEIVDEGSSVASVVARLDGREIALPHQTSSVELAAGDHVVEIIATDAVGNVREWSATFTTYAEQPSAGLLKPTDGAEVFAGDVTLQAKVEDPTGDTLDVQFLEGRRLDLEDGDVRAQSGTVADAGTTERGEGQALTSDQVRTLAAADGISDDIASSSAFPYQLFDVAVGEGDAAAAVRSSWSGRANAGATVILSAMRADGSGWDEVDRAVAASDDEAIALAGVVPVAGHDVGGAVRLLVQHSEGFAGADLTARGDVVEPHNAADVPRSAYDFTIAWESDTQYYNENTLPGGPYRHQTAIHEYLQERREALNLQYMFHTGDIVDDWDQEYQWENADLAYDILDGAGIPYGVLAGNHDVGNHLEDYTNYGRFFGDDRFAGNPWFGGSFQNNRGHYDLVSAGGIDFLMLYTGWLPGDESIAWMNEVLAQYPERVAIIAQHEFMLTTGGLGDIPQRVEDEVVATNPNVRMVLSGHYHDAFTRTETFDDDGDGIGERAVSYMLFDYQGLPEGGQGFLRLLHFDNEGRQMLVRTYSPSLDRYNSDEPSLAGPAGAGDYSEQEFAIGYDQLRIEPGERTLGTDAFSAEILGATEIESFAGVPSGTILTATWALPDTGERGWYVRTSDPWGAVDYSPVSLFTVVPAPVEPETPAQPETPGAPGTPGDPGGGLPGGADGTGTGGSAGAVGSPAGAAERGALAATGSDSDAVWSGALLGSALLAGGLLLLVARRAMRRRAGTTDS
ncbi:lamin tail domain-containing protein [Microbacterium radiodurans]|uniref:LTD domain-containing protein n=1 Tax=Microbacterium radiodurans TaxID=661398 RepID=A0A5J5IT75_9MICO|nr:lamin tail domain-containing protein [Microbacterium radiodurans]KAA9085219.1 hypothetical protein F6B42_12100 [Microbacterium radiodurans]